MKVMDKKLYQADATLFLKTFHKTYYEIINDIKADYLLMYLYETRKIYNKLTVTLMDYKIDQENKSYFEIHIYKNKRGKVKFKYVTADFIAHGSNHTYEYVKFDTSNRDIFVKIEADIFEDVINLLHNEGIPRINIYEEDDFIDIDSEYLNLIQIRTNLNAEMNRLLDSYAEYGVFDTGYDIELQDEQLELVLGMELIAYKLTKVNKDIDKYFIDNDRKIRKYDRKIISNTR